MKTKQTIERLLYFLVVILSLAAIALVIASPPEFIKNKVVYQGF
jgi:hypothetical protein